MKNPIQNASTEALAVRIAKAIAEPSPDAYSVAIAEFKSLDLKRWEVIAFSDRVHYLVDCYKKELNDKN